VRRKSGFIGAALALALAAGLGLVATAGAAVTGTSAVPSTTTAGGHGLYAPRGGRTAFRAWQSGPATRANAVIPAGFSIVASPSPSSNYNELDSTSCVSATFCVAVGFDYPSGIPANLTEQWNGSAWSVVSTPAAGPPNHFSFLYGVDCISANFCIAVGYAENSSNVDYGLVEQWNGSTWTIVPTPAGTDLLDAVNCLSPTSCTAVGYSAQVSQIATLIEHWNGSAWSVVASPSTSQKQNRLFSVACMTSTECFAVGVDYDTNADYNTTAQSLLEQWNGSSWSIIPSPVTGATVSSFNGVSCYSTAVCVAVGGGDIGNILDRFNGTTWDFEPTPVPTYGDYLNSVDCFGPTSCVAGGWANLDNTGTTWSNEVMAWNGGTWNFVPVQDTASTGETDQVNGISCVIVVSCTTVGFGGPKTGLIKTLIMSAPVSRSGYYEVASDGGIFAFGARFYGSTGNITLNKPVVAMAVTPDGGGYWFVASDGGIFAYGDALFYGSMGGMPLNEPIVGMTPTADGLGYWLVASDGGIFAFGDANFYGSMGGMPLNEPIVGIAATPDGLGYYMVASDGGIFAFGDATFQGSMGGKPLNSPIVGIGVAPNGGYYEVATDGGLFAFGVPFLGSMGGQPLVKPIVGMLVEPGGGYYEVASDGGLFAFGAPFFGSMGGKPLNSPIVGIAG